MATKKIGAMTVRRKFNDLTGRQFNRRNDAFNEGWRIVDHWCGRYQIAYKDEVVATVVRSSTGALNITMH